MFNLLTDLNWLAVLLADVAAFVLGGVWFVVLFPRFYASALGRENEPPSKPAAIFLVGPLLCNTVAVVTSAILLRLLGVHSLGGALLFGGFVGFGYLTSTTVNTGINPNIPRPLRYGLVSGAQFFVSSLVMSVVLVLVSR